MVKALTKRRHVKAKYRSGLEDGLAAVLTKLQSKVRYEVLTVEWEDLSYRKYTPDFLLDNGIIIEAKGLFDNADRRKHLAVKKQHPELDIRFVFSNPKAKLYKGAVSCNGDWCTKHGFKYAHRVIPLDWINELGECMKERIIKLKGPRKDL